MEKGCLECVPEVGDQSNQGCLCHQCCMSRMPAKVRADGEASDLGAVVAGMVRKRQPYAACDAEPRPERAIPSATAPTHPPTQPLTTPHHPLPLTRFSTLMRRPGSRKAKHNVVDGAASGRPWSTCSTASCICVGGGREETIAVRTTGCERGCWKGMPGDGARWDMARGVPGACIG